MPPEAPTIDPDAESKSTIIRDMNDEFRRTLVGGQVLITPGVLDLGNDAAIEALRQVRLFDDFTPDNDPHREHDFGEVKVEGQRIWFKIDLYDKDLQYGSPNPADPDVTARVMTILLPSEY